MKSSATPLQQAYFDLLGGSVTVGGVVPVYDTVPDKPDFPYIHIDLRTGIDLSSKSSFGEEVTQTVWIVDRFEQSFGSRVNLNAVANAVVSLIRTRPVPLKPDGFEVRTSTLDIDNFSRERTETHTYMRRELRFRHLIHQT